MKEADFKVLANSNDITALIRDRFIKLSVRDAAGEESDTVTIELDNRDDKVNFPSTGATLDVYIGPRDGLVYKGTYEVDELEESLEESTLTIHGKAAKMKGSIKSPRDATFDDITFGALVRKIAAAHGYQPAISPELEGVRFGHIDQKGESDMNLLTRLARDNGAVAKPMANRLVVVPKGKSKTVSGQSLPEVSISDPTESTGRVTVQERNDYSSVIAHWFDEKRNQKINVKAGSGEPSYSIRRNFKDEEAAKKAADAKLKELKRGKATLSITRPLTPAIVAEGKINVSNHKRSANGLWLVDEVEHVIESGSVSYTSASCVTPE